MYCSACGEKLTGLPESARSVIKLSFFSTRLGIALLNLTGLGLGYLITKRWLRWLAHFALTAILVGAAFGIPSIRLLSLAVLVLWLVWMAVDGWLQSSRRMSSDAIQKLPRSWLLIGAAVLVFLLEGAGFLGFIMLGQREFSSGIVAYEAGDCRTAMQHFNRLIATYGLTFSHNLETAQAKIEECSLFITADNARQDGEYADSIAMYETYLRLYPKSPLIAKSRETAAQVYKEWAMELSKAGEYQTAIDKYQNILGNYAGTVTGQDARAFAAETYSQWAGQLLDHGKYPEAAQKYEFIIAQYPETLAGHQAKESLPAAYWKWALFLHQEGEIKEALKTYELVSDRFPDASVAQDSQAAITNLFTQATNTLESGKVCQAVPLLDNFVGTGLKLSSQAEAAMPEALYNCGVEKHKAADYPEATALYSRIVKEFSSNPMVAEANHALNALEADSRCSQFKGERIEQEPFEPEYGEDERTYVEITNDAQDSIQVLFCAGDPRSDMVRIDGCPTCEAYANTPSNPREEAKSSEIFLEPGEWEYEVLFLCGDCPSPLTSRALYWKLTAKGGEKYMIIHYVKNEASFPFSIPTIPPFLPTPIPLPPLVTPTAP
jgi:tetratricopeptide (TPR) repeat protein